jgi:hypothetical protein
VRRAGFMVIEFMLIVWAATVIGMAIHYGITHHQPAPSECADNVRGR